MPNAIILNEGEDDEIRLPTSYEVCSRCKGEGTHDAWDSGMTQSEMGEQDDEFREDYAAGRYAVPCTECHGQRVIATVDEAVCSPEQLDAWHDYQQDRYEMRAEMAAERRAGC